MITKENAADEEAKTWQMLIRVRWAYHPRTHLWSRADQSNPFGELALFGVATASGPKD